MTGTKDEDAGMADTGEIDTTLPDARRVEALAGFGLSAEDIGRVFDIAPETINSIYARELAGGQAKANARVAESLYRMALGDGRGAVTAAIFWLKTRARWKEEPRSGDQSGEPVIVTIQQFAQDSVPEQ